jgi:hypothetical protein
MSTVKPLTPFSITWETWQNMRDRISELEQQKEFKIVAEQALKALLESGYALTNPQAYRDLENKYTTACGF